VAAIHVAGVRGDPCGAVQRTYLKVLRHVSILTDHHQEVCLYLAKVTELFKNLKKI